VARAKGLVRVARDKGGWGKYQPALIYVDGRHVANVLENTVLELNLPVGAATKWACRWWTGRTRSIISTSRSRTANP